MRIGRFLVAVLFAVPFACAAQQVDQERERALIGIATYAGQQSRTDPHYTAAEDELLKEIEAIARTKPPAEWLAAVRRRYVAISERIHSAEWDRIRQEEQAHAGQGHLATVERRAADLEARFAVLEKDLFADRIGLRLHALHAFHAAAAYFPQDSGLLALRRTRIPLATAYEMGNIDRGEFDERWGGAVAAFDRDREARRRDMAQFEAQLDLEESRAQGSVGGNLFRSIGDQIRRANPAPRPPVTCTTMRGPGGISTTRCQ